MRPFSLLIKPSGPDCNLNCKYCFYSGKTELFGADAHRTNEEVLEKLVSDYMNLGFEVCNFAWQGGEPTLMGLDFYKKVVSLQQKHGRKGQVVSNALQTNGILLDEKWCRFLAEYKFLVGISLDGSEKLHNYYRLDRAGGGTFEKVMGAIKKCRAYKVEFNILTVLNDKNVIAPDELFDFFISNNFRFLQFIPCVEKDPKTGAIADFSVTPKQYGGFLCKIFDRWLRFGPEKISIRLFDSILSFYVNGSHTDCTFGEKCDEYVVVEHNGDVFCCDFFVDEQWKPGDILETPLKELFNSEKKRTFAQQKRSVCDRCFVCRYYPVCRGGCLKDRIVSGGDYKGQCYFCESYKQFFEHALDKLKQISAEVNYLNLRATH